MSTELVKSTTDSELHWTDVCLLTVLRQPVETSGESHTDSERMHTSSLIAPCPYDHGGHY
jgi:hypothetical protein